MQLETAVSEQAVDAFMQSFWGAAAEFVEPLHVKAALTAALPFMGVGVKALEWKPHPAGGVQALAAGLALYRVHPNGDSWYLNQDYMGQGGVAAAQADYEQRIRSALVAKSIDGSQIEKAHAAVEELANSNLGIPLEDWSRISSAILSALIASDHGEAAAAEKERLRFEGDLDKWMKTLSAGITGYQPEAYTVMDLACQELVKLRAEVADRGDYRRGLEDADAKDMDAVISKYATAAIKYQGDGLPDYVWHLHFREFAAAIRALSPDSQPAPGASE